jgi:chemotaxis protein MotA
MQKLIGLGLVLICVFGGFVMASGRLIALWQPAEMVIILGAGLGALFLGNSAEVLKETWRQLKEMMRSRKNEQQLYPELLKLMHRLLEEARLKGLKSLDEHIEAPFESPLFGQYPQVLAQPMLVNFIADNLRMLGMGRISAHEFDALLEQEIAAIEDDLLKPSRSMHRVADAMPGFGILAAVGGIIITMQHLDGPLSSIGVHVAAALVGTFIGIFCCYCLFEPASSAMAEQVSRRVSMLECVKAILVAQVGGKTPLLAVDAGRKVLEMDAKPSFATMEAWVAGATPEDEAAPAPNPAAADNVAAMPRRRNSDR